nr:uncharacterized protein LOC108947676 [Nicotiana tomentosiformis]
MKKYELFSMKESEPIQEMVTRFTIITNKLKSLGKVFTSKKLVSKALRILLASWESKAIAIQEATELDKISLDELVGNLKTHEIKKIELRKEEPRRDKALVLKASEEDEFDSDDLDLAMFAKFKKFMRNSKNASKRENNVMDQSSPPKWIVKEINVTREKRIMMMKIVRSLPRNVLCKASSCISAHDIWINLEANFGDENLEVVLMAIKESQIEEELMDIIVTMMSKMDKISDGNDKLISNLSCVKLDLKELESDKANLEGQVKDLKNQVLELTSKNEKNKVLQENLEKEKYELFSLSKWYRSSDALSWLNENCSTNKSGIGYRKFVLKFDPKYVEVSDNKMCTHFGKVGHFRDTCPALIHAQFKNTFGLSKNVKKEEEPKVKSLVKSKWIKVNRKITVNPLLFCAIRDLRKHVRASFKSKKVVNTSKPLELLHIDLCGPIRVRNRGGKRMVQQKMGCDVLIIRTEHGTEFENCKFFEFCITYGIDHNFSAPRTLQENDVMERKNRPLEDMGRTMLIASGLLKSFWAEVVNTACYLINRYMFKSILEKTPYELLRGRKTNITHLRAFGCKYFVHNSGKEALGKFDDRSDDEVLLVYSPHSKSYKDEDYDIGLTDEGTSKEPEYQSKDGSRYPKEVESDQK